MKNLKTSLMYIANIIIGVLTYVFLSQSYIGGQFSIEGVGGISGSTVSGYDIIANYFDGNGTQVMMAISNLVVAILAGVLILSSIYCMLVSFGAIKKSKAIKMVNFINIIASLALVVFGAISLFCTIGYVNDNSVDNEIFSAGAEIGWAVIVNLVISVVALVTSFLGQRFSKK